MCCLDMGENWEGLKWPNGKSPSLVGPQVFVLNSPGTAPTYPWVADFSSLLVCWILFSKRHYSYCSLQSIFIDNYPSTYPFCYSSCFNCFPFFVLDHFHFTWRSLFAIVFRESHLTINDLFVYLKMYFSLYFKGIFAKYRILAWPLFSFEHFMSFSCILASLFLLSHLSVLWFLIWR